MGMRLGEKAPFFCMQALHLEYIHARGFKPWFSHDTREEKGPMAMAFASIVEHLASLSEFSALRVDFTDSLFKFNDSLDFRRWEKIRCFPLH